MAKKNKNKKLTFSSGTKEADDSDPKEKKGSKKDGPIKGVVKIKTFMKKIKSPCQQDCIPKDRSQSPFSMHSSSISSSKRRKIIEDDEEYYEEKLRKEASGEEDLDDITLIKDNESDSEPQKTDIDYDMKRQKQIIRKGDFNSYHLSDFYNSSPEEVKYYAQNTRVYEMSEIENLKPKMYEAIKNTSVKFVSEEATKCLANNTYSFVYQIVQKLIQKARIANMSVHLTSNNPLPNQLGIIRYQSPNVVYQYNPILLTICTSSPLKNYFEDQEVYNKRQKALEQRIINNQTEHENLKKMNEFITKLKHRTLKKDDLNEFYPSKPDKTLSKGKLIPRDELDEERRKATEAFDLLLCHNKKDLKKTQNQVADNPDNANSNLPNAELKSNQIPEKVQESLNKNHDDNEILPDKILNVHFSPNIEVDNKFISELSIQDKNKLIHKPPIQITARELVAVLEDLNLVNSRHYFRAMLLV